MEELFYIGVFIAIMGFGALAVFLKHRLQITEDHLNFFVVVLDAVDYVNNRVETKGQKHISHIVEIVFEAKAFVDDYEEVLTPKERKQLIKEKTEEVLNIYEIDPRNQKVMEIVNLTIGYVFSLESFTNRL